MNQHGGYPISDAQCKFLNEQGLILVVRGQATVLSGVSVANANISLMSINGNVISDTYQVATRLNTSVASQDFANRLLYEAIGDSISGLDFSKASKEVRTYLATRKQKK